MDYKQLTLSCGKKINIYKNLFTSHEREHFKDFAQHSVYKVGRQSTAFTLNKPGCFFSSYYSDQEDHAFGFNNTSLIKKLTENFIRVSSWVNATIPGSMYYSHVDKISLGLDKKYLTILYCVNGYWDEENGGEILFHNSYGDKEIAVDFSPGQVILFDSLIPHKPAYSYGHFEPRFMYVCVYEEV